MKIERIIAKDSRTANEQAILKYGKDVLVVSNSKVNGMTELIVAVEIESDDNSIDRSDAKYNKSFKDFLGEQYISDDRQDDHLELASNIIKKLSRELHFHDDINASKIDSLLSQSNSIVNQVDVESADLINITDENPNTEISKNIGISTILHNVAVESTPIQNLQIHNIKSEDDVVTKVSDIQLLMQSIQLELKQLRTEVRVSQQLQAWASKGTKYRWNEAMCSVGIEASLRALFLADVTPDCSDERMIELISNQIKNNFSTPGKDIKSRGLYKNPSIHVFLGPAGGGKTSMLAKIAHQLSLKNPPDDIIMISWCDTRPGSWSELQMWAAKIGALSFKASDSDNLDKIISKHKGSYILIDVPADKVNDIEYIFKQPRVFTHLILPSHTPGALINKWINNTLASSWSDVYISRMDESSQPWPLLIAVMNHKLQVSYASNGFDINDLISDFDAGNLLSHSLLMLKKVASSVDRSIINHGELSGFSDVTNLMKEANRENSPDYHIPCVKASLNPNLNPHGMIFQ